MTEAKFHQFLGYLQTESFKGFHGDEFVAVINEMVGMLDSSDMDDYFGTEGWRHYFGWDE